MFKRLFSSPNNKKGDVAQEKMLLSLELSEIKEVADILFSRLEEKIKTMEALESSIDRKAAELERLLQRAEAVRIPNVGAVVRGHEVRGLARRGMKTAEIAEVLGMPIGEVELILELETAAR